MENENMKYPTILRVIGGLTLLLGVFVGVAALAGMYQDHTLALQDRIFVSCLAGFALWSIVSSFTWFFAGRAGYFMLIPNGIALIVVIGVFTATALDIGRSNKPALLSIVFLVSILLLLNLGALFYPPVRKLNQGPFNFFLAGAFFFTVVVPFPLAYGFRDREPVTLDQHVFNFPVNQPESAEESAALQMFYTYAPNIERDHGPIQYARLIRGDLNSDDRPDVIIEFGIGKAGESRVMERQSAIYLNTGDSVRVVGDFNPAFAFRIVKVASGIVEVEELDDYQGQRSIRSREYEFKGGKLVLKCSDDCI